MKRRNFIRLTVLGGLIAAFMYGCSVDYPNVSSTILPHITTSGTANFTKFVVVGNSLTAGYQSGGLSEKYQVNSYGAQIARQLGIDDSAGYSGSGWEQPVVADPGTSGILSLNFATTVPTPVSNPSNNFTNVALGRSYDNMGVPGAFVYDFMNCADTNTCWQKAVLSGGAPGKANYLFTPILRGLGTQFQQVRAASPTFIIWWEGHNDILGYATGGAGVNGVPGAYAVRSAPPWTPRDGTEAAGFGMPGTFTFGNFYQNAIDSLSAISGAKVIVGNIPDVSAIPFFTFAYTKPASPAENNSTIHGTTIIYSDTLTAGGVALPAGPALLAGFSNGKALYKKIYFQEDVGTIDSIEYITLVAISGVLGNTTSLGSPSQPYGLHPARPLGGQFTITNVEKANIQQIVTDYNTTISTICAAKNITVVDFHTIFDDIAANGIILPGEVTVSAKFISGGLFSLDGVHPTSLGYAVVANSFIDVINSTYGSDIPNVNESAFVK